MRFEHSFHVALPPEQAFALLTHVSALVPCFPGAELVEEVDEWTCKGSVKVRLGPVTMQFAGTTAVVERDVGARTAAIKANATETKGRGGAQARTQLSVTAENEGARVNLGTELTLSGMAAQYGRASGILAQVAGDLVQQFAECLNSRLTEGASTNRASEISGGKLVARATWNWITRKSTAS